MRSTHIFLKIDVRHQDPWSRAPEYDAMTQVVCDCDVRVGPCFGGTFYAESGFSISPEGTRTDPLTACSYCSDLLRGARNCSELLGTARNCSEVLGTARNCSELPRFCSSRTISYQQFCSFLLFCPNSNN